MKFYRDLKTGVTSPIPIPIGGWHMCEKPHPTLILTVAIQELYTVPDKTRPNGNGGVAGYPTHYAKQKQRYGIFDRCFNGVATGSNNKAGVP